MKQFSPATFNILAAGQALKIDLYAITLAGGSPTYYFTSHQIPVIVGGQLYQTGLVLTRGTVTQSLDLQVESLTLKCSPQSDNSSGAAIIAGLPFLQAAAQRVLDGARVLYSKLFLNPPELTGGILDTSPGAVPWFQGRINTVTVDRLSATLTINADIEMLNVNMPANVIQPGCSHTWADQGCGLIASNFAISGVVTGGTVLSVTTNLTQPDVYFSLGKLTFNSGPNATTPATTYYVKQYTNAGGTLTVVRPLANAPQAGDTFVALPGCPKTLAACGNTNPAVGPPFNNLKRNRSMPFVPVPETLYDGGTAVVTTTPLGSQGNRNIGTPFGAILGQQGAYKS